jgi:hypothetical protein
VAISLHFLLQVFLVLQIVIRYANNFEECYAISGDFEGG